MDIKLNGKTVQYQLQYKSVKNINVRIKPDGFVYVSAPRYITPGQIEGFLKEKADFILRAQEAHARKALAPKPRYFTEEEIKVLVLSLCQKAYPYFEEKGFSYPEIRFRKMVSRWGSCQPVRGILTFSLHLMYAPPKCVEYVVWHEFTHFLEANHSRAFYDELEKVCPDWKESRKRLKEIQIR